MSGEPPDAWDRYMSGDRDMAIIEALIAFKREARELHIAFQTCCQQGEVALEALSRSGLDYDEDAITEDTIAHGFGAGSVIRAFFALQAVRDLPNSRAILGDTTHDLVLRALE